MGMARGDGQGQNGQGFGQRVRPPCRLFLKIREANMEPNWGAPSKRIHFPDDPDAKYGAKPGYPSKRIHFPDDPEAKYGAKPGYPLEKDPFSGCSGGQIWSQTGVPPSKWIHFPDIPEAKYGAKPGYPLEKAPYGSVCRFLQTRKDSKNLQKR